MPLHQNSKADRVEKFLIGLLDREMLIMETQRDKGRKAAL